MLLEASELFAEDGSRVHAVYRFTGRDGTFCAVERKLDGGDSPEVFQRFKG